MSKTDAELRLIGQLARSLEACPEEQRTRILDYLIDRFAQSTVNPLMLTDSIVVGRPIGSLEGKRRMDVWEDDPSDEAESEGRN